MKGFDGLLFLKKLQIPWKTTILSATHLIFGRGRIDELPSLLPAKGSRILLAMGGGSIRRIGLYDKLRELISDYEVFDFSGIEPNPRVSSVNAAAKLAREQKADFIVAVGGGSVIDASKAIAAAVKYEGDAWDLVKDGSLIKDALPLFSVLTLAATGSEYDAPGVISNMQTNEKSGDLLSAAFPKASFCDPSVSASVPAWHTAAGAADIMPHTFEQYLVSEGNDVSDGFCETILKTVIKNAPIASRTRPISRHAPQ